MKCFLVWTFSFIACVSLGVFPATADQPTSSPPATSEVPRKPLIEIPLWNGLAPGTPGDAASETRKDRDGNNAWVGQVKTPTLTIYQADPSGEPTSGIVICPGGGYGGLAITKEGHEVAQWLAARGVTAGVLKYRCGGGPHQHPIPSDDARRAVRLMRKNASDWNLDSQRIGILGFSAGGHLASTVIAIASEESEVDDLAQTHSGRVNFGALIYPVISMQDGVTHGGSRKNLLGDSPDNELVDAMSSDQQVDETTCPTFLVHATDDHAVPVENSLRFYRALVDQKIDAELHIYDAGGHGFGMFRNHRSVDQWPILLKSWMDRHGW